MVTSRGASSVGCLIRLLVLVLLAYVAIQFGEPYLRYYRFQDRVQQAANFARGRTDQEIIRGLAFAADSLGMPGEANPVRVIRGPRHVEITSRYSETVDLIVYQRDIAFTAEGAHRF